MRYPSTRRAANPHHDCATSRAYQNRVGGLPLPVMLAVSSLSKSIGLAPQCRQPGRLMMVTFATSAHEHIKSNGHPEAALCGGAADFSPSQEERPSPVESGALCGSGSLTIPCTSVLWCRSAEPTISSPLKAVRLNPVRFSSLIKPNPSVPSATPPA